MKKQLFLLSFQLFLVGNDSSTPEKLRVIESGKYMFLFHLIWLILSNFVKINKDVENIMIYKKKKKFKVVLIWRWHIIEGSDYSNS